MYGVLGSCGALTSVIAVFCMYFCFALSIGVKKPRPLGKTPTRKAHRITTAMI